MLQEILGEKFKVRAAQNTMAGIVNEILTSEKGGTAFVEAGTGTGKSFAYLIPSLLSGKRVIISTAKKALQKQLYEKDLPFLLSRVQNGATYALLKGKGNYACRARFDEVKNSDSFKRLSIYQQQEFETWLDNSPDGDLSDANFIFESQVRVVDCIRKHCPYFENDCGYIQLRQKALDAKVVVVNHALLAYDLVVGGGKMLGAYDAIIIDEAHQAPKYFRDALSIRLFVKQGEYLKKVFKDTEFEPHDSITDAYEKFFNALGGLRDKVLNVSAGDSMWPVIEGLERHINSIHAKLTSRGLLSDDVQVDASVARERARLRAGAELVKRAKEALSIIKGENLLFDEDGQIIGGDEVEYLCYAEHKGRNELPELVVTPIEIGSLIAPALINAKRVVITSATLSSANGMEYIIREFGFSPKQVSTQIVLPSPFDYKSTTTCYVSGTSPDPAAKDDGYYDVMAREIHELLAASKGGAFVLCASYDDMGKLYEAVRTNYMPLPYNIGMQSGTTPETLIEWFKKTPNAVLFAVKTFWEGVDIPGLGLRLVVIPRLPFPNFGDVLLQARKKVVANRLVGEYGYTDQKASMTTWMDFDFQEAIMDLKQGAGRLKRREDDMGVVALLDRRAFGSTKGYSSKVRSALPMPTTSDKASVLTFLSRLASKHSQG